MGTVLRIPTYTYYDNNTLNRQSSISFIMDDALRSRMTDWYRTYGESGHVFDWTGSDINGIPGLVNNAVGFPLLSKKSGQFVIPIENDPNGVSPSILSPNITDVLTRCNIEYMIHTGMNNPAVTQLYNHDNNVNLNFYANQSYNGWARERDPNGVYYFTLGEYFDVFAVNTINARKYTFEFTIFPEDFIIGREFNPIYKRGGEHYGDSLYAVTVNVEADYSGGVTSITHVYVTINLTNNMGVVTELMSPMDDIGSSAQELDTNNPYGEGGSATVGGGDGAYGDPDATDPAEIPDLPSISAADLGFITMYNPTAAQLKALSDFMWSGAFDLATYKKLFSDPMQSIIGLAIVPVQPAIGGFKNVKFGTIDSGVGMNYLSTNYVQLDCGSVSIDKYVGCFMDNEPYTKISIYLPFIGIRQISADDCMGRSLHVVYNIDVLTGACACFIEVSGKGVLYSYNGSCITNVPLTAVNFSGAIQNAVSAIGSAIGIVAGVATDAAPVTAMSIAGLATSAANTALNSKPQVQRSGNLGGSAGIMSIMTPYVIIERPNMSVPNKVQKFVGQTSNITMYLGDCSGFTMCEYVHLDNLNATSEEIVEIESMLRSGVIF
jgi:hypothetical protein